MVKVINVHLREGDKGNFMSLELHGDLEMVQSANTGRFYATARKCFISSTFTEQQAKSFIGKELPGEIVRVQCEPYDYTIEDTGEVISLTHSYTYVPEVTNKMQVPKEVAEMA